MYSFLRRTGSWPILSARVGTYFLPLLFSLKDKELLPSWSALRFSKGMLSPKGENRLTSYGRQMGCCSPFLSLLERQRGWDSSTCSRNLGGAGPARDSCDEAPSWCPIGERCILPCRSPW